MTLYFITGNPGKLKEVQMIMPDVQSIDIDVPEIQSLDPEEIISEKLKEATKERAGKYFVEDTSLYIDCLGGLPGPLIKWFLKTLDNQGIYNLVSKHEDHSVTARTIIGYFDGNKTHFFTGELKGKIVAPRGEDAFGWDLIFQPKNLEQTLAEIPKEEKNKISMRYQALKKLKEFLDNE